MLTGVILVHVDYVAASRPELSGMPLEMCIDASDYGICATLCQRPAPHKAPKTAAMFTQAFDKTQLNWSAMEREFYGLWKGVVKHERYNKGLRTYVYIGHKKQPVRGVHVG